MNKLVTSLIAAITGYVAGAIVASSKGSIDKSLNKEIFIVLEKNSSINDELIKMEESIDSSFMMEDTKRFFHKLIRNISYLDKDITSFLSEYISDRPKRWSIYKSSLKEKVSFLERLDNSLSKSMRNPQERYAYIKPISHEIGVSMEQFKEV